MFQTFNSENGKFKDAGTCSKCGKLDYLINKGEEQICRECLYPSRRTRDPLWDIRLRQHDKEQNQKRDEWYVPKDDTFE
jgi:ribosomal protein L37E